MAKVLNSANINEILAEYQNNDPLASYRVGLETFHRMPPLMGRGYWREIQLRPGLQLTLIDVKKRHVNRHQIQHSQSMPLTFSYYLAGRCQVDNDCFSTPTVEVSQRSYIYCLPNTAEVEEYQAGDNIRNVRLKVSPELIQSLGHNLSELPADLKQAIEHPKQATPYYSHPITPTEQRLLQKIFDCPYQGLIRQLYLESKVLELLALQIDQLLDNSPRLTLSSTDMDRIYQAESILMQNMIHPPSLIELSRQVHLNDRKLKEGFRQVFGTTVFGYLHGQRMQQAQELLQEHQITVKEVAKCVGYASRSSFVAAFKKYYNTSPSCYLKDAKGH